MNIMILVSHPDEMSFNISLSLELKNFFTEEGHHVYYNDLYRLGFDPRLKKEEIKRKFTFDETVIRQIENLEKSEFLVIIHPDWWGQPPAILKGWVDRVLIRGVAYQFEGEDFMPKKKVPLLQGKKAVVICTTDRKKVEDRGILKAIWEKEVFSFCGGNNRSNSACRKNYGDRL